MAEMRDRLGGLAALDRRSVLRRAAALLLGLPPVAGLLAACGGRGRGGMMMEDGAPEWMMSGAMGPQMMRDMPVIHDLLVNHEQIRRDVEDARGGVRAVTTSSNPGIAELIRNHVRAMSERIEEGNPIRQMDPLFREIFEHYEQIELRIEEVRGGVRVVETSDDPQVTLLIRQHARRAVSEFVRFGMARAMRATPLPPGYEG
jgi:hypothetical protein